MKKQIKNITKKVTNIKNITNTKIFTTNLRLANHHETMEKVDSPLMAYDVNSDLNISKFWTTLNIHNFAK